MIVDLLLLASLLSPIVGSSNAEAYANFLNEEFVNEYYYYSTDAEYDSDSSFEFVIPDSSPLDAQSSTMLLDYVRQSGTRDIGDYSINIDEIITILGFTSAEILLAIQATEKANVMTNTLYPNGTNYQDDGDAFRHTYWSALLTRSIGATKAKQLTDAHETSTTDPLDKEMDLRNNASGRSLYNEWVNKFHYSGLDAQNEIAHFIHHCVANGEVYDCVKFSSNGDKLVYTDVGVTDTNSYGMRGYVDSIDPEDYGFEERYYFYEKSKNVSTNNNATISTNRRRTGYIQEEYIVLSPRREGAGYAFLELVFSTPVLALDMDITLWSQFEYLDPQNCYAYISERGEDYGYDIVYDLLNDCSLSTDRTNPNRIRFNFCDETTRIMFSVQTPGVGDRNKGRVCLGQTDIIFANTDY